MNRRALAALLLCVGCTETPAPTTAQTPTATPTATATAPTGTETPSGISVPADIAAVVAAPDRLSDDKALDGGRHPAEMLAFYGIKPGMRVAELGAGGGYTSELLARAVGPSGAVFGQNTKLILGFAEQPWSERLKRPSMSNVTRVDREFDDPLPPQAKDLDAVLVILFYHDLYWMDVDRAKMNKAIFASLKPGGLYGIIDHSARAGSGASDVKTLHRIEESEVKKDVEAAGFKFVASADFLKSQADNRDWSTSPGSAGVRRGTSDRFVLTFRKPQ
jgi:predicted methyltransferase